MAKRTFIFDGSDGAAEMLSAILNHYADVAFPLGGSECAAASREAVHSIIGKLKPIDDIEISRRQRPMLRSAVKWFYNDSVYASPNDPMYINLVRRLA
jgi:hypothetical protein